MFILFLILLFIIAFLYASVGHGGASGYLALMALFQFAPERMREIALYLNILVAFFAFLQYYRKVFFSWSMFFWLIIASVPMAYLGGSIHLEGTIYKKILGLCLIFPILKLIFYNSPTIESKNPFSPVYLLITGGIIGFISGLIGIGGGILLTPILLLLRWADIKEAAIVSALFIIFNSLAGLAGHQHLAFMGENDTFAMLIVAGFGGGLGAYWGAKHFPQKVLIRILSLVLTIACLKLLLT